MPRRQSPSLPWLITPWKPAGTPHRGNDTSERIFVWTGWFHFPCVLSQLFSFIKRHWQLQTRLKWALNPRPERAFIPRFEVRINGRDELTQRCGQIDVGKSCRSALCLPRRCVLTPWKVWVACCSHSTCQNRFPLKWSITFTNKVSHLFIISGINMQQTAAIQRTSHENPNIYWCM